MNCSHPFHTAGFCVKPGGKMASHSMVDAMAAQHAHCAAMNTTATNTTTMPRGVAAVTKDLTNTAHASANVVSVILPNTPLLAANTTIKSAPLFNINSVSYMLTPTPQLLTVMPTTHTSNLCVVFGLPVQLTASQITDLNNFEGYLAASGPFTSSLDWAEHCDAQHTAQHSLVHLTLLGVFGM